jgi:preprotein translocase subunit SecG
MPILSILLYIVFVLAAIVLIVVILLQEGRGGGFGQALGEHGQQTFGVAAKGIHRFTMGVAFVFLASAVLLHMRDRTETSGSVLQITSTPADPTQPPGQPAPEPKDH